MIEPRPPNLPGWAGVETKPFRAFRLTNFEAQRLTDAPARRRKERHEPRAGHDPAIESEFIG